jgi:hypothetical protein
VERKRRRGNTVNAVLQKKKITIQRVKKRGGQQRGKIRVKLNLIPSLIMVAVAVDVQIGVDVVVVVEVGIEEAEVVINLLQKGSIKHNDHSS